MEKSYITLILHKIKTNGRSEILLRKGLSFKQIAHFTERAIELGLIEFINEKISITDIGLVFYEENIDLIKDTDKESWIELDKRNKIFSEDINFIYLPNKNSLNF